MSGRAEAPSDPTPSVTPLVHHEGFVEKKGPKEKDYEKQWLMLIDNKMVVHSQRISNRELGTAKPLESVTVDRNWDIKVDAKDKVKLSVKCKTGVYKFRMSTSDDRDNWWIRMYTLSKRELPKVHLLPGQTLALQEIIESMKAAPTGPVPSPTGKAPQSFKRVVCEQESENKKHRFYPEELIEGFKKDFPIPPTWYFDVNRAQAELILLNNPEHGAILIRKSESRAGSFSLSMRQDPPLNNPNAEPVIKHFTFSWHNKPGTFKMDIEESQPQMRTMYDLLAFFIEKHGGNVRPMQTRDPSVLKIMQHPYELGLRVALKDPENGESPRGHQDNYLQPTRAAPQPPSRPRPDRQSLPANLNVSYLDAANAGELSSFSPHNAAQGTGVPPQLPPPRERSVSTSSDLRSETTPASPRPYVSSIRAMPVKDNSELAEVFKSFGIKGDS